MAETTETRLRVREPIVEEKGVGDHHDVPIGKPQVVAANIVVESDEDRNNRDQEDTEDDPLPRRRAEKANGRERERSRNRAGKREAVEFGHLQLVGYVPVRGEWFLKKRRIKSAAIAERMGTADPRADDARQGSSPG